MSDVPTPNQILGPEWRVIENDGIIECLSWIGEIEHFQLDCLFKYYLIAKIEGGQDSSLIIYIKERK